MGTNRNLQLAHTLGIIATAIDGNEEFLDPELRHKHLVAMVGILNAELAAVAAAQKEVKNAQLRLKGTARSVRDTIDRVRGGVQMRFGADSLEYAAVGGTMPRKGHHGKKSRGASTATSATSANASAPVTASASTAQTLTVPVEVKLAPMPTNGVSPPSVSNGASNGASSNGAAH